MHIDWWCSTEAHHSIQFETSVGSPKQTAAAPVRYRRWHFRGAAQAARDMSTGEPDAAGSHNPLKSATVKRSISLSVTAHRFATTAGLPASRNASAMPVGSNSPLGFNNPLLQPMSNAAERMVCFRMTSALTTRSPAPWPQYRYRPGSCCR